MNIIKTILSWQPWKIAVTAVSSVAVVSGAATGVGVTIAHNVNEQTTDSAYVSESNQDTPVFAPVESGTEPETEATTQAKTQPETQAPPSTTTTEPTTQEKITWTYDPVLSRELGKLIEAKFPGTKCDDGRFAVGHPENFVKDGVISEKLESFLFIQKVSGDNLAQAVFDMWGDVLNPIKVSSSYFPDKFKNFYPAAYKSNNGYVYVWIL